MRQVAAAVVLGAGLGERLGLGAPKGLARAAGRSLLDWSASALAAARGVARVVLVIPDLPEVAAELERIGSRWRGPARLGPAVPGGATRQESLARGLEALAASAPEAEWVLVHDAARCLVEPADAERVLAAARESGAAIPVIPLDDTLKELDGERVARTLDRGRLARAQTPQGFRLALLREALDKARRDGFTASDCASLVERLGAEVRVCPGREGNFKVTRAEDLARAELLLRARAGNA